MPINAEIPLRVERPRFMTPGDLLSLRDLQTRSQLNQFNLEQAPEEARLRREGLQTDIDYKKALALSQIGKQGEEKEKKDYEEAVRHASALVAAAPQERAGIWKAIRQWSVSKDPQNDAKLPQEWDESLLPKFQALAYGAMEPGKAAAIQAERQAYPAAGQPQQVPLSQVGQLTSQPAFAQEGVPLPPQNLPPQGPQFGTGAVQPWSTGTGVQPGPNSMTLPTETVTDKMPEETPDSLRREAKATEARGGKVNYEKAKDLRARADKLDDRIGREFNQAEQIRVREEAIKGRQFAEKSKGIENANKLRDDFTKASKVFVDTKDAYTRIRESASSPSAAGDLALIFNYMKLLDPGSVVREGEFATAQNTAGVPDRVRNYYNRLISGERLGDDQRIDFVDRAEKLYKGMLRNQENLEKQYGDLATRAGIDKKDVVINFRPAVSAQDGKGPRRRKEDNNPPKTIKWDDIK